MEVFTFYILKFLDFNHPYLMYSCVLIFSTINNFFFRKSKLFLSLGLLELEMTTMVWPCKIMDRTRTPRRILELKFIGDP
jgi:hypothetical protein